MLGVGVDGFKVADTISLSYIFYIVFALALILAAAYAVLFFVNKKIRFSFSKSAEKNITIIETKYAPKIGHISLISVSSSRYLIVNSTNGVAISPVADIADKQSVSCQYDVAN